MIASTHFINFTSHHDSGETGTVDASRKSSRVAVLCIAAFIAWYTKPAVVWLTQFGLSTLSHNASDKPPLPACVAPVPDISSQELHQLASAARGYS